MKIFITGACGQLGHDCVNEAESRGFEVIASDIQPQYSGVDDGSFVTVAPYQSLDITDQDAVTNCIMKIRPDVIIHCASWTLVDAAEDEENREKVYRINADGTRYIAGAAEDVGAKMLYISTDYVFDGHGERPWKPDDTCFGPGGVYADSKLEGEKAVAKICSKYFIVRIAWAFGLNGNNFVKTMINIGRKYDEVRVVYDQVGTPTYMLDLSKLLMDMAGSDRYGYYHATNSEENPGEYISWYDFCCEIYRRAGLGTKVIPVTTAEYGKNKAVRPFNSRLDKSKLAENGFSPLPTWKDALERYLKEAGL